MQPVYRWRKSAPTATGCNSGSPINRRQCQDAFRLLVTVLLELNFVVVGDKIEFVSSLIEYNGKCPRLAADVFVADGARLIGDVVVGAESSLWFNAVLRGDIEAVIIGHHSNIQDNVVCHVDYDRKCVVGNYVTVGHSAILHGCTLGDEVLVGMGAVVMTGVMIGSQCLIGARSLLTEGMQVPAGSLVYGSPAKVVNPIGATERAKMKLWAEEYCRLARTAIS